MGLTNEMYGGTLFLVVPYFQTNPLALVGGVVPNGLFL